MNIFGQVIFNGNNPSSFFDNPIISNNSRPTLSGNTAMYFTPVSEGKFLPNTPYCLQYEINPKALVDFEIRLTYPTDSSLSPQVIQSFHKMYKNNSSTTRMTVVFVPFTEFRRLTFVRKDSYTLRLPSHQSYTFKNIEVKPIKNIKGQLAENKTITKIGIQANPFTYFVLNDEPIRVGRNGIY